MSKFIYFNDYENHIVHKDHIVAISYDKPEVRTYLDERYFNLAGITIWITSPLKQNSIEPLRLGYGLVKDDEIDFMTGKEFQNQWVSDFYNDLNELKEALK